MKVGILISNNSDHHPPAAWADATAGLIGDLIQIDENSTSGEAVKARRIKEKLIPDLADALTEHHHTVKRHVDNKIAEHGLDRLSHELEPEPRHIEDALATVNAVLAKTPFAEHFQRSEVQDALRARLAADLRSVDDIARSWHADRNLHQPEAQAYRQARDTHGPHLVHATIHQFRKEGSRKG
jgi:hypothetical protein